MKYLQHLFVVACLMALAACSEGPRELRIGVPIPLSGDLGAEGKNLLDAATLAAEEIQARAGAPGGAGLKVTIVPADDKGGADALPAAEALVSKKMSAVIGHLTSGASMAAAPVYSKAGVPQLSMATHPGYTRLGLKTTFRLLASDEAQARALGSHCLSEFKGRGFAVVNDRSVYGKNLADSTVSILKAAGQAVAFEHAYDPAAKAFPELIAALAAAEGPKVVLTTMEVAQAELLVRALVAAGRTDVTVIGGDTLKTGPVPKEAAQLKGYLSTTPVTDVREYKKAGETFVLKYTHRFGHAPVDAAHYMYDAVHLLAQTALLSKSTDPEALTKALRTVDPTLPVTGYLRFRDDGEPRYGSISVYRADKGMWRLVSRASEW